SGKGKDQVDREKIPGDQDPQERVALAFEGRSDRLGGLVGQDEEDAVDDRRDDGAARGDHGFGDFANPCRLRRWPQLAFSMADDRRLGTVWLARRITRYRLLGSTAAADTSSLPPRAPPPHNQGD